MLENATKVQVW